MLLKEAARLRPILDHGEVTYSVLFASGDGKIIRGTLEKAVGDGLVMRRDESGHVSLNSPLAMMRVGQFITVWINPTLQNALEFVLAEQGI